MRHLSNFTNPYVAPGRPEGHATFSTGTHGGPGGAQILDPGDQSRARGLQGCSESARGPRYVLSGNPRRPRGGPRYVPNRAGHQGGRGGGGVPVPPLVPPCPPSSDSFPQPTLLLWKGQHHNHAKHGMVLKGSEETAGESQLKVQHYSRQGQSLAPGPIKGAALFAPGPIEGAALFAPG